MATRLGDGMVITAVIASELITGCRLGPVDVRVRARFAINGLMSWVCVPRSELASRFIVHPNIARALALVMRFIRDGAQPCPLPFR